MSESIKVGSLPPSETRSSVGELDKLSPLSWTSDDAKIVGDFLRGNEVSGKPISQEEELWKKIVWNVPKEIDKEKVLGEIREQMSVKLEPNDDESDSNKGNNEDASEDTSWWMRKSAEVILNKTLNLMDKYGLLSGSRGFVHGRTRMRDGAVFAEEIFGPKDPVGSEKKDWPESMLTFAEGGPTLIEELRIPTSPTDTSTGRVGRSLAHEMNHVMRNINNNFFWNGMNVPDGVELPKPMRTGAGSHRVGANKLGSEGLGDFLKVVTKATHDAKMRQNGEEVKVSVNEIVPELKNDLIRKLKAGKSKFDYVVSSYLMVQHLEKLAEEGFGDLDIVQLLGVGTLGHITLDKLPHLIRLGLIDRERMTKMGIVCREVVEWLSEYEEE